MAKTGLGLPEETEVKRRVHLSSIFSQGRQFIEYSFVLLLLRWKKETNDIRLELIESPRNKERISLRLLRRRGEVWQSFDQ